MEEKTLACLASVYESVSIICYGNVGHVVKNGRTHPVKRGLDSQGVRQRDQIVRHTYDLGRDVNMTLKRGRHNDSYVCHYAYRFLVLK